MGNGQPGNIIVTRPGAHNGVWPLNKKEIRSRTKKLMPAATAILPHLQARSPSYDVPDLARDMATRSEFFIAHPEADPNDVLAFAYFRHDISLDPRDLWSRPMHVFEDLGVTIDTDVMEHNDLRHRRHLQAVINIVEHAVMGTPADAEIYIRGFPGDTRRGLIFESLGFRMLKGFDEFRGSGETAVMATREQVLGALALNPGLRLGEVPPTMHHGPPTPA